VAGLAARRLWQMMIGAAALSALLTTAGLALSYDAELPVGATTILLTAAVYLVAHMVADRRRRSA